ncbi:hypothetical protein, partial [Escherichia coli]|uniref:hypothetical protein n=1 Tax=Escherichia coli TaxID=562 RepID=UPI001BB48183
HTAVGLRLQNVTDGALTFHCRPPRFLSIWRSVDAYALTSNALVGLSTDATSQEKLGLIEK